MSRVPHSRSAAYRSGTTQLALAMDTTAKRKTLAEQLASLREKVEEKRWQIKALKARGRHEQAAVAYGVMMDAIAKAQLVADRLAKGDVF